MKIKVTKEELLKAVNLIQAGVSSKSTLPILNNFLIETENEKCIKIISTDLEIGIRYFFQAEVIDPGAITIPAERFRNIIHELPPKKEIEITTDEKLNISILCQRAKFVLSGMAKEEYPTLPTFDQQHFLFLKNDILKKMLSQTVYAVSSDETRYVLNGIYFVIEEGKIKLVATDGRRLAYVFHELPTKTLQAKAIIPTKSIIALLHILSDTNAEEVGLSITERQATFKSGDAVMVSRLIEGDFPNYEQVIPQKFLHQIRVSVNELLTITKQIVTIASEKTPVIKMLFDKNILHLSAVSQGVGTGDVDMELHYSGPRIEISFNPMYILDFLKNITEEEVIFQLNGPLNAAVVRPYGNNCYLCVIMPVRTQ